MHNAGKDELKTVVTNMKITSTTEFLKTGITNQN